MLNIRSKTGAGIAIAVVLAIVAGIGIASGAILTHSTKGHSRGKPVPLTPRTSRLIAANQAVLARRFPVFHKAHISASTQALPETFAKELAQQATEPVPLGGLAEPDPSMAVYVGQAASAASGGTVNVWVMPGANDLCIAQVPVSAVHGSVECQSDENAAAGRLMGTDEGRIGSTTIGLLPGSATSATVHNSDGTNNQIPVTNGLWVVNNDPEADSVSVSGIDQPIPVRPH
jgi:hypothetical protein